MKDRLRIAVVGDSGSHYLRAVYHGVAEYSRSQPRPFSLTPKTDVNQLRADFAQPDGIIALISSEALEEVMDFAIPTVNVTGRLVKTDLPTVISGDQKIGRVAAEHLLGVGFRNFGYYGSTCGVFYASRGAGFARAL